MPFNKFQPDTLIVINGAKYRPIGYANGRHQWMHLETGEMFRCSDRDGAIGLPTDEDYSTMLEAGNLQLKSAAPVGRERFLAETSALALTEARKIDPAIDKKMLLVRMLDDDGIPNGDKAISEYLAKFWTAELIAEYGEALSTRQIRRLRVTRGHVGHRLPGQFASFRGRMPASSRSVSVAVEVEWKHALTHYASSRSLKNSYADYVAEMRSINEGVHPTYVKPKVQYRTISFRTFERRVQALEDANTIKAQKGVEAVHQDWSGGGAPLVADFAMQMVQIDHTVIDVFVVDDELKMVLGRAYLSIAIDVRTRAIVAYLISFVAPSVWTVGEILRRMVLPKRPPAEFAKRYPILVDLRGKPTELIIDNATEFRSQALEAAARGAGFNIRWCPIKKPRYRAVCERAIGTINRSICDELPGRTLPINEARRLGYDAEKSACITMIELEAIANFCVAEYNVAPREDCGNQPAMLFEKDANRFGINNFTDFEAFRIDTMAIEPGAQLTASGIKAFGNLRYHDARKVRDLLDDLVCIEPRRQRRDQATATVDYRYDPADISRIHVWNRKARTWVELVCSDEQYASGMPLWFHEQIRAEAKRAGAEFNTEEERLAARARLIAAIKAISPEASARARKRVGELYEIPRLRQITGNIVHLETGSPHAVSVVDFISNDRAELTSLDAEILAPRTAPRARLENADLAARRAARAGLTSPHAQAAGTAIPASSATEARPRRRAAGKFDHKKG